MKYLCDRCGKLFVLETPVTFDDMKNHRIVMVHHDYFHISCASVRKSADGSIHVNPDSQGRLIKIH